MDLWTFNKLAAATLLSLLVIIGANTGISILYPEGKPGTFQVAEVDTETQATDTADGADEQKPAEPEPLPVLLASADPSAGEKTARACTACHSFEEGGPNKVGPNLYAVPGREVASVGDFSYSNALTEYGGEWTYERLDCFLKNPSGCVSGTSMGYAGIKDPQKRADLIAYMASLGDTPPFPEPEQASETASAPADESGQTTAEAAADDAEASTDDAAEATGAQEERTKTRTRNPLLIPPRRRKPASRPLRRHRRPKMLTSRLVPMPRRQVTRHPRSPSSRPCWHRPAHPRARARYGSVRPVTRLKKAAPPV